MGYIKQVWFESQEEADRVSKDLDRLVKDGGFRAEQMPKELVLEEPKESE